jgi:hypothetical protein
LCRQNNLSITLTFIIISTLIMVGTVESIGTQFVSAKHINVSQADNAPTTISGIKGTVYFIGADCPPKSAMKVPPCSGPYPGYDVTVYAEDGKNTKRTVKTDTNGNYFVSLRPGNYIIDTQPGRLDFPKEAVKVIVTENHVSRQDLHIDTGLR